MPLSALDDKSATSHIVYTRDGLVSDFVLRVLREKYGLGAHDVIDVETKSDVEDAHNFTYLQPENFDKWVLYVDLEKSGLTPALKTFQKSLRGLPNIVVVFKTSNWGTYQQALKAFTNLNDISGSFIRKDDLSYILAKSGKSLPTNLLWYISGSYGSSPTDIFRLVSAMAEGTAKIHTKKDVIALLGLPATSVVDFCLMLLEFREAKTDRKLTNRRKALIYQVELLVEKLGAQRLWNEVYLTLWDMLEVRKEYASGHVYREFHQPLDSYEPRRKSRAYRVLGNRHKYKEPNVKYYNRLLYLTQEYSVVEVQRVLLTLDIKKRWSALDDVLIWSYSYVSLFDGFVSK